MKLKNQENSVQNSNAAEQPASQPTSPTENTRISDEIAARALAEQHGVEYINLAQTELSPQVVRLVPQQIVTDHNVIAVKLEDDTLYVAMTDPVDLPTLDQINLLTGFNVKPMVATARDIAKAISQHYGAEQMTKQDLIDARFDADYASKSEKKLEDLVLSGDTGQAVKLVNSIIKEAIDSLASDIHFEPNSQEMVVRFRIDGILHDCLTIPATICKEIVSRLKILAKLDITEKRKPQDGHMNLNYKDNDYDLRVSIVPTIDGEKTVLRILDKSKMLIDLTTLGISDEEISLVKTP